MKHIMVALGMLFLFMGSLWSYSSQSGWFNTQSTQGLLVRGSGTLVEEKYNITVYADYLDVELELVLKSGGNKPDSFANALEFTGRLNLINNSVIIGMITWYNGEILKGKLKTKEMARQEYEEVVDRNVIIPPRPRDPVLIEEVWDNRYNISIFPVEYGKTRKFRIRYLVPGSAADGINKIIFPNALSSTAKYSIKKDAGIKGYKIITNSLEKEYKNNNYVTFSNAEYEFQAYGTNYTNRIRYITPVLNIKDSGSIFYAGQFSSEKFSGQMVHVSLMGSEEVLKYAQFKEDYVILWRWNHPEILAKYARQIVSQSGMLQKFLGLLNEANERVALVIHKEGGERIIFSLDKKGGTEYNRMLAYLKKLSEKTVIDPPLKSIPGYSEIEFDLEKSFKEFEEALELAKQQFDKKNNTLKHILIITAGPRRVNQLLANQSITWNSDINVSLLRSFINSRGKSSADFGTIGTHLYWPGVNLEQIINTNKKDLEIIATVGNSIDSNQIKVLAGAKEILSCYQRYNTQMHLFAATPVKKQIMWEFYQNDKKIYDFIEEPQIVKVDEGIQYARLLGASPHLVPLAQKMPSSIAATLGFIDKKYSLVALEEDALPKSIALKYENSGVPLLNQGDIFAALEEVYDVPVEHWIEAHPPRSMGQWRCEPKYYNFITNDSLVISNMMYFSITVFSLDNTSVPLILNPIFIAPVVTTEDSKRLSGMAIYYPIYYNEYYYDYEAPLVKQLAVPTVLFKGQIEFFVSAGIIIIDLPDFADGSKGEIILTLYDLSGRIIKTWYNLPTLSSSRITVPIGKMGIPRGVYMLRLSGSGIDINKKIVVW